MFKIKTELFRRVIAAGSDDISKSPSVMINMLQVSGNIYENTLLLLQGLSKIGGRWFGRLSNIAHCEHSHDSWQMFARILVGFVQEPFTINDLSSTSLVYGRTQRSLLPQPPQHSPHFFTLTVLFCRDTPLSKGEWCPPENLRGKTTTSAQAYKLWSSLIIQQLLPVSRTQLSWDFIFLAIWAEQYSLEVILISGALGSRLVVSAVQVASPCLSLITRGSALFHNWWQICS